MTEPYRLRYTNQLVGGFLLLILMLAIGFSVILLRVGDYFVQKYPYWTEISQQAATDLERGAEVLILGQYAGNVTRIGYVPGSDQVRIDFEIDAQMTGQVFTDSYVTLERQFGVGKPFITVRRGAPNGQPMVPLQPESRLRSLEGDSDRFDQVTRQIESVSESIRLIQQQLDPVLSDMRETAERFQGTLNNAVDPTLTQVNETAVSVKRTSDDVRPEMLDSLRSLRSTSETLETKIVQLVDQDLQSTLADVSRSTQELTVAARSVSTTSDAVNQDMSATLLEIRQAAQQVQQLALETRNLVRVVRAEADDLPGTTARINDTVSEAQDLVGEIRGHWLLRRYSKKSQPSEQIPPQSVRRGIQR